ncbi:hypothetical protein ACMGE9_11920 [Macrococcus sp. EM39E]|uniref:hypothetical protein n=1 Tax=Macrococcus animalis TaxID=3395467 RepID=UPI0039BEADCF
MNLINRILVICGMIAIIAYFILNYEFNKTSADIKHINHSTHINALQSKEYISGKDAMNDFRNTFFPKDDSEGHLMNPDPKSNPKFYSMYVNKIKDDMTTYDYAIGYAIQNPKTNKYRIKIVNHNINPKANMKSISKSTRIGNTIAKYYVGDMVDNTLKNGAGGTTDESTGIAFQLESEIIDSNTDIDTALTNSFSKSIAHDDTTIINFIPETNPNKLNIILVDYELKGKVYVALALINNGTTERTLKVINPRIEINKDMKSHLEGTSVNNQYIRFKVDDKGDKANHDFVHHFNDNSVVEIDIK